jgi:molybdopterin molybdotransferase
VRLELSVEAARERIFSRVEHLAPDDVPLAESLGLTLARDISAPIDLPRFTNSAMDGVALHAVATIQASDQQPARLQLVGRIDAGQIWDGELALDQAVGIGTGAAIPGRCDAVLPAEHINERDGMVEITRPIAAGRNVRYRGEDIQSGAVAVRAGSNLRPQEIALLAALGIETIPAIPRPAVTVLSIGPELLDRSGPARVNDANGPMLAALAEAGGADVVDIIRSDGDLEDLFDRLDACETTSDLVITSGGISNSQADTMADLLEPHPQAELWEVRLRPGKHFGFAWFDDFSLLALPGNPIAALVGFELFGRPLIDRLAGRPIGGGEAVAVAAEQITGGIGRTDAVRGRAWLDATGRFQVTPTENRGSSVLSSLPQANCLILLPEQIASVEAGETVSILWVGYQ